jgi:predicted homoserine dehydrogenase-like protein
LNLEELLRPAGGSSQPVRTALIGVGQFGLTLLSQSRRLASLALPVLCDRDVNRVVDGCLTAGLARTDLALVESVSDGLRALESGKTVITEDPSVAVAMPVDLVVEATGHAEAGARNCLAAIGAGRHVVLVTKETDSVVGPLLSLKARQAGVVLSQVDGDQPSLLLGLVSWARTLGLDIACAGKASEYDFVYDPQTGVVEVAGLGHEAQIEAALWGEAGDSPAALVQDRARALTDIPQRTAPDYCELCLVANGSGLKPDVAQLHAAVAKPSELPDIFIPRAAGGVLSGTNRLDIFNCFRRRDEISFAGGVFAVLHVPDAATGELFRGKGIPTSTDGQHVLVYNPTHLLGVEAPLSILVAGRLGMATGSTMPRPVCDVVMRAARDLPAGTPLEPEGHHHAIAGVEAQLHDYRPLDDAAPAPYYLAPGAHLKTPLGKGEFVPLGAIDIPADSILYRLRSEQDRTTFE